MCGQKLRDNHRDRVCCPKHHDQQAINIYVYYPLRKEERQKYGIKSKGIKKRFKSYVEASKFLNYLKYQYDNGGFDPREHRKDNPLSFSRLAEQYLEYKRKKVPIGSYRPIRRYILRAIDYFKDTNVKYIKYPQLEDFLDTLSSLSSKTQHNALSVIHDFFRWMKNREVLKEIPNFPSVKFSMERKKTIPPDVQHKIIEHIKKNELFRAWLAVKFLSTYISIRPGELFKVKWEDIIWEYGFMMIRKEHAKKRQPKLVPITAEDLELLSDLRKRDSVLPTPNSLIFCHDGSNGTKLGQPWGHDPRLCTAKEGKNDFSFYIN